MYQLTTQNPFVHSVANFGYEITRVGNTASIVYHIQQQWARAFLICAISYKVVSTLKTTSFVENAHSPPNEMGA